MSSLPERCQGPAGTQGHGEWQFLRDRVTWNDGELARRGAVLSIGRARVAGGPVTPERETVGRRGGPGALLGLSGGAPHPAPPSGVPGGPQPRTLSTAANKHPSPAAGNVARDRPPGSAGPAPRPAQPVTAAPGLAGPQGEAGTPGQLGWRAREALCRAGGPRRLFPGPPGVPAYLARAPPGAGGLVPPVLS